MRHFTVAIPTHAPITGLNIFVSHVGIYHFGYIAMATNAVFEHHSPSGIEHSYALLVASDSKNGRMPHTIFGFKKIGSENIVVRHMTIVAGSISPM